MHVFALLLECVPTNTVDAYSWDTCFAIRSHACTPHALVNYVFVVCDH